MATSGRILETTIAAGEDLNTNAFQYHAIALDDGLLANNAEEASGILINKPKTGEGLTLCWLGELKFAAGAAVAKGAKLTVVTSGWFTTAGSSAVVIGECKAAVTSGSVGTGLFSFPQGGAAPENFLISSTPIISLISGVAYHLDDRDLAATVLEADCITQASVASGYVGSSFLIFGKGIGRMAPSQCSSLGDKLMSTTSGYLALCTSGYTAVGRAISNIGSNDTGNIFFWGGGVGYQVSSLV